MSFKLFDARLLKIDDLLLPEEDVTRRILRQLLIPSFSHPWWAHKMCAEAPDPADIRPAGDDRNWGSQSPRAGLVYTRRRKLACPGNRVPQADIEEAVLQHVAENIFTADRVRSNPNELAEQLKEMRASTNGRANKLQLQLQDVRDRMKRQYEFIESGTGNLGLVADRFEELKRREGDLQEQLESSRLSRQLRPARSSRR